MRKRSKNHEQMIVYIDVESIPGVPGASGRVPGAPQHRKIMKNHFCYNKSLKRFQNKIHSKVHRFEIY